MSGKSYNNLVARKHFGKKLTEYKKTLSLNQLQKSVLIGTLLGDASMSSNSGKAIYSVKFEQKLTQVDYINHLYTIFSPYVGTPPRNRVINNSFHIAPGASCWFRTYSHISLKFYYDLFYLGISDKTKVKVVPKNIVDYLDPIALAYWFMDDGTSAKIISKKDNAITMSFVLSTQGFSYKDQLILIAALEKKFGIYSSLHKDKKFHRLVIRTESCAVFLNIIKPYIQPSFLYKIGL